ncbi:MAG TPA: hypothetical protein VND19_10665 [Acetobacteraceae bacterium]|nr:hypothetical protein [Acetobacteraceae bacterium]
MGTLVEVSIPVDAEAAAALQDPLKRQALGRVISRWFQPENAKARLLDAMDRLAVDAKASGLTEEILNEELVAYNAERRS